MTDQDLWGGVNVNFPQSNQILSSCPVDILSAGLQTLTRKVAGLRKIKETQENLEKKGSEVLDQDKGLTFPDFIAKVLKTFQEK